MTDCFFVSDLHGRIDRYSKLFRLIEEEKPEIIFVGGDILPTGTYQLSKSLKEINNFISDYLIVEFEKLQDKLGSHYPKIYLILGNDDAKIEEDNIIAAQQKKLWYYSNLKRFIYGEYNIIGYSFIPPTPFLLKDWEKYDVSRYVDPGCISPEEGKRTMEIEEHLIRYSTIKKDLEKITENVSFDKLIFLSHSPPYKTNLDRAALDGKMIDHVPLDVNVGSIAIKKMIEEKQPYLTMHGHIHESTRLTGNWRENIGKTLSLNASHDGPELSLIKFKLEDLKSVERILI